MPTTDIDTLTATLHALRVKGFADADALAEATGLSTGDIEAVLQHVSTRSLAVWADGRIAGWRLTPEGKTEHRRLLDEQHAAGEAGDDVIAAYERFVAANEPFKRLCTRWQLEGQPPGCIAELIELDATIDSILTELSRAAPRFATYCSRFTSALTRLRAGDTDAFTRPLSGSYHDVWMELHQDLLLTLDRERSSADGH